MEGWCVKAAHGVGSSYKRRYLKLYPEKNTLSFFEDVEKVVTKSETIGHGTQILCQQNVGDVSQTLKARAKSSILKTAKNIASITIIVNDKIILFFPEDGPERWLDAFSKVPKVIVTPPTYIDGQCWKAPIKGTQGAVKKRYFSLEGTYLFIYADLDHRINGLPPSSCFLINTDSIISSDNSGAKHKNLLKKAGKNADEKTVCVVNTSQEVYFLPESNFDGWVRELREAKKFNRTSDSDEGKEEEEAVKTEAVEEKKRG